MPELQWGETPWDNLSREDLLREVQRMYAAVLSADGALSLCRGNERGGFWSASGGTGGRALAKCELARAWVESEYDHENVYRAFFRYAVDLLFSPELGFGWTACDGCDVLTGPMDGKPIVGQPCSECARQGRQSVRRPLEWRDLERKRSSDA